jgi:hypothetical protein
MEGTLTPARTFPCKYLILGYARILNVLEDEP